MREQIPPSIGHVPYAGQMMLRTANRKGVGYIISYISSLKINLVGWLEEVYGNLQFVLNYTFMYLKVFCRDMNINKIVQLDP